jgi:hypothetical protein
MSSNAYKLLGLAVWRGAKWYVRKRLPPTRRIVTATLAAITGMSAAVVLARRVAA